MARNSEILDMAVELAADLHKVGAMDKATLRKVEALAVPEVRAYSAEEIRAIRERNRVSQPVFARYLNTSQSTVQKWETGAKRPSGPALKLLSLVQKHGLQMLA